LTNTKREDSSARLKYVRLLDRFLYSIVSFLSKGEDKSIEQFRAKVKSSRKHLDAMEAQMLYREELLQLQKCVFRIYELSDSEESIENIKKEVLKSANLLDKNRQSKKHKREKNLKIDLEEW